MVGGREAIFVVSFVAFMNFVRTCISPKFSLVEREISHKVHKGLQAHKVADDSKLLSG